MLRFRHDDVSIYDVSGDLGNLFGLWNTLVMSYICAKFHCDTTIITCHTCIFHVCFFLQKDVCFFLQKDAFCIFVFYPQKSVFFYKRTDVSAK